MQGKSRDVIVRELQRTNLNVNEAVNNLLSRDDDEMDDLDDTSEAYLHEELLSLLDAGLRSDSSGAAAAALLDSDSIYSAGDGYEYLISRDLAKRKGEGLINNPVSLILFFNKIKQKTKIRIIRTPLNLSKNIFCLMNALFIGG